MPSAKKYEVHYRLGYTTHSVTVVAYSADDAKTQVTAQYSDPPKRGRGGRAPRAFQVTSVTPLVQTAEPDLDDDDLDKVEEMFWDDE